MLRELIAYGNALLEYEACKEELERLYDVVAENEVAIAVLIEKGATAYGAKLSALDGLNEAIRNEEPSLEG